MRKIRSLTVGLLALLVASVGAAFAADLSTLAPDASIDDVCKAVLTDSAPESPALRPAAPGESVTVTFTWDKAAWKGDELLNLVACPDVGGKLIDRLSLKVSPIPNTGSYNHGFTVSETATPGTHLCDRAVLFGRGPNWALTRRATDPVCLVIGPTAVAGATEKRTPAAAPPAPAPAPAPARSPASPAPAKPAPSPSPPAPTPAPGHLARTGGGHLAVVGGMLLLLGGLAMGLGAGQRRQ